MLLLHLALGIGLLCLGGTLGQTRPPVPWFVEQMACLNLSTGFHCLTPPDGSVNVSFDMDISIFCKNHQLAMCAHCYTACRDETDHPNGTCVPATGECDWAGAIRPWLLALVVGVLATILLTVAAVMVAQHYKDQQEQGQDDNVELLEL